MHRGYSADMAARAGGTASGDPGEGRSVAIYGCTTAGPVRLHIGRMTQGYRNGPGSWMSRRQPADMAARAGGAASCYAGEGCSVATAVRASAGRVRRGIDPMLRQYRTAPVRGMH